MTLRNEELDGARGVCREVECTVQSKLTDGLGLCSERILLYMLDTSWIASHCGVLSVGTIKVWDPLPQY